MRSELQRIVSILMAKQIREANEMQQAAAITPRKHLPPTAGWPNTFDATDSYQGVFG